MSDRDHIALSTELAAALLQIEFEWPDGTKGPVVEDLKMAKQLTPKQIRSLFELDHWPRRKKDGGPDEPWNLKFRPVLSHRLKTAKRDIPEMAKSERLQEQQAEFRRKMLAKVGREDEAPPAPEAKRKGAPMMGSRASPYKRKINGETVRRER